MATVLEKALLVLGIKTEGLSVAKKEVKGFTDGIHSDLKSAKVALAGYFSVSFAEGLKDKVVDMAKEIKLATREMGTDDTDRIQRYGKAFEKMGLSLHDATRAFDTLLEKRKEALKNGGESEKFFRGFGIGEKDLRSIEDGGVLFEKVAQAAGRDPKSREAFLDEFGSRRGGLLLGAANQLKGLGEFGMMSKEEIEQITSAAREMKEAQHEFAVAAGPFVAALYHFASVMMRNIGFTPENEPMTGEERRTGAIAQIDDMIGVVGTMFNSGIGTPYDKNEFEEIQNLRSELTGNINPFKENGPNELRKTHDPKRLQQIEERLFELRTGRKLKPGRQAPEPMSPTGELAWTQSYGRFDPNGEEDFYGVYEGGETQTVGRAGDVALYSASRNKINKRIQDRAFAAAFGSARDNDAKKKLLDTQASKIVERYRNEDDPEKRADILDDLIKIGQERYSLDNPKSAGNGFKADSLAALGGFSGGAIAGVTDVDSTKGVLQTQVGLLRDILNGINGLPADLRDAIINAATQPINDLK